MPRWHRLFYFLVSFAVFTVSLSLYLSHRYRQIYVNSVAVNQAWTERLYSCSRLGRLAAAVNAPGNDVFQSNLVGAEEDRLHVALDSFDTYLATFQSELQAHADAQEAPDLLVKLQGFAQTMRRMTEQALELFSQLRSGQTKEAGATMAAMDRHFAVANQVLERLRGDIAAVQKRHFENQLTVASSLQRFQYGMSTLLLVMIGGSLAYGQNVRRQVDSATREKESSITALRDSEAQLDRRVHERTAELVQANDSLTREIDERSRAEEALRRSETRYRSLVAVRQQLLKKLLSAQEDERRRIARDLHDEIGQALTSLLIGLRSVADATTLDATRDRAHALRQLVVSALEEVRRLARGLRPSVLDDLGLPAALERFAADYAQAHAIEVDVDAPDAAAGRLPEEIETALYRIAQEALTNTAKHAQAKHARLILKRGPSFVQLVVADDGRGFARGSSVPGEHLGLSGMQERAALLNGSVVIDSDPGRGTKVTVRIPCAGDGNGEH